MAHLEGRGCGGDYSMAVRSKKPRAVTRRAWRWRGTIAVLYYRSELMGAIWLRRGSRNLRCMPRCSGLVNNAALKIVANDDNYALAA